MASNNKLINVLKVLGNKHFSLAMFLWPKFSITSFLMVSRLKDQNINPRTVIDIGANVGQFTVSSYNLFGGPIIYSFEPDQDVFQILQKNIKELRSVRAFPFAIGSSTREVEFHVNSYNLSSSVLPLGNGHKSAFPSVKEETTIQVAMTTLDDSIKGLPIERPCLLKIDVQGYEAEVINGAKETLKMVDYVIIETSFMQLYVGEMLFLDIVKLMESSGFLFLSPVDISEAEKNNQIIQMDCLFVRINALK